MATKSRKKFSAVDKLVFEDLMEIAALTLEPDAYSIRTVIHNVMPDLYALRKQGASFERIHKLLTTADLPFSLSTLKTYYARNLIDMREECETHFIKVQKMIRKFDREAAAIGRKEEMKATQIANAAAAAAAVKFEMNENVNRSHGISRTEGQGTTFGPAAEAHLVKTHTSRLASNNRLDPASRLADEKPLPSVPLPTTANVDAISQEPSLSSIADVMAGFERRKIQQQNTTIGELLTCITVAPPVSEEPRRDVPPEAYSDALLEHPAIPGLFLTRAQRLTPGRLRYRDASGEEREETGKQVVNRLSWTKPMPATILRTSGDAVEMDSSILGKRPANFKF